ncbi:hypothetical protein RhiirA5_429235 [Rhizophagus irregularis]|uniref:Uncharacterized protein n=1 Tax=Rhizophagus irregularis TaxID=588596 RepID=A0A2N0NYW6_9GLOM|nr:hypothetical protein RhiirA5_429235 [Rhizophagus irregularis]GET53255.1 hypothetical protein GLOIN_2v1477797 [Rhizophagus irregularis DAOM 181602=DAOM 197198]
MMYRIVKELANYTIYDLSNSNLNAYEYLHIKGRLINFEIINTILNANKEDMIDKIKFILILEKVNLTDAKKAIDKTIKFLYKQKLEFDNANKELKILKKLHKKVKLLIVNNFKQLVFHYFQYNNNV